MIVERMESHSLVRRRKGWKRGEGRGRREGKRGEERRVEEIHYAKVTSQCWFRDYKVT